MRVAWNKGLKTPDEVRKKLSISHMGNTSHLGIPHSPETKENLKKAWKRNPGRRYWKGDEAGYSAVHAWLRKHSPPTSNCCEKCGNDSEKLELAVIPGHKATRNREDYQYLCIQCHKIQDLPPKDARGKFTRIRQEGAA